MKFDMPKGAVILANLSGRDAKGKKTKREWRKHTVVDVTVKDHTMWIDIGQEDRGGNAYGKVLFSSARIDSPVLDHTGQIVCGRFKLRDAAQDVYSAKPLWWFSKLGQERAATVLEVWMYEQNFVPYEGWRLMDMDDGSDVRTDDFVEKVWRAPIRITRSNSEAKEDYFDEKRLAEIKQYEELYENAKKAAREASALATKYRLKLAVLKRMR